MCVQTNEGWELPVVNLSEYSTEALHNGFLLTLQIRDQLPKLKAIVQYTKELVEKEESVMDVS